MEKSGLIILICLLLFACTKEEANFVNEFTASSRPADCSNDSLHTLHGKEYILVLEKSLESVNLNKPEKEVIYKNNRNDFFIFNSKKEEKTYIQSKHWICPEDTSAKWPFIFKYRAFERSLTRGNHKFNFSLSCFAIPNENYPFTYSDVLNITLKINGSHYLEVLKYVIDKRSDKTANNDHLKFSIVKEIDGIIFKDVFENTKKESTVYFNIEFGFLGYKNNKTRDRLTLVP